jgi:hypothetical protein
MTCDTLVVRVSCRGRDSLLFNGNLNEPRFAGGGNRLGVLEVWEDDEAYEM